MEIAQRIQPARGLSTAEDHLRSLIDTDPTLVWTSSPFTFSYSLRDELDSSSAAQVRLLGFGIASRLPRERQAPELPQSIARTLAYMAPEQTGRMNRSIESRSDLYALGIPGLALGVPPDRNQGDTTLGRVCAILAVE